MASGSYRAGRARGGRLAKPGPGLHPRHRLAVDRDEVPPVRDDITRHAIDDLAEGLRTCAEMTAQQRRARRGGENIVALCRHAAAIDAKGPVGKRISRIDKEEMMVPPEIGRAHDCTQPT